MGSELQGKSLPFPKQADGKLDLVFQIHAEGGCNKNTVVLHLQTVPPLIIRGPHVCEQSRIQRPDFAYDLRSHGSLDISHPSEHAADIAVGLIIHFAYARNLLFGTAFYSFQKRIRAIGRTVQNRLHHNGLDPGLLIIHIAQIQQQYDNKQTYGKYDGGLHHQRSPVILPGTSHLLSSSEHSGNLLFRSLCSVLSRHFLQGPCSAQAAWTPEVLACQFHTPCAGSLIDRASSPRRARLPGKGLPESPCAYAALLYSPLTALVAFLVIVSSKLLINFVI